MSINRIEPGDLDRRLCGLGEPSGVRLMNSTEGTLQQKKQDPPQRTPKKEKIHLEDGAINKKTVTGPILLFNFSGLFLLRVLRVLRVLRGESSSLKPMALG
jgi:hypothetical protein